jgi:hypothetical protein
MHEEKEISVVSLRDIAAASSMAIVSTSTA